MVREGHKIHHGGLSTCSHSGGSQFIAGLRISPVLIEQTSGEESGIQVLDKAKEYHTLPR